MSNTNSDASDIKQAAENADAQQIEKNLKSKKSDSSKVDAPEELSDKEQTPFIDDALRTDK